MVCHMHQPNMFVNTYLGYTMWDYESDAPFMWPEKQKYPTRRRGAARSSTAIPRRRRIARQVGRPRTSSRTSASSIRKLKDTQFADYHGHGWNFRAVFKRDRKGNLLDADGKIVADDDPEKFKQGGAPDVIHLDMGMQCVDCHFAQDAHGNGHIYGEVADGDRDRLRDCHGTVDALSDAAHLGPGGAAGRHGPRRCCARQDGQRRFEWRGGKLYPALGGRSRASNGR